MASAWWVKLPLIAAAGACGDVACRRRIPAGGLAALGAAALATLAVTGLKDFFERTRPPVADPSLDAIGVIPASTSFPSGHAATAFAAAVAVGLLYPRLRKPLFALAALIALSRVYLGRGKRPGRGNRIRERLGRPLRPRPRVGLVEVGRSRRTRGRPNPHPLECGPTSSALAAPSAVPASTSIG